LNHLSLIKKMQGLQKIIWFDVDYKDMYKFVFLVTLISSCLALEGVVELTDATFK